MNESAIILEQLRQALHRRFGIRMDDYSLPPSSFTSMQGEVICFDEQAGTLSTRFPILDSQLNPFHVMQGGFLAAAVDNTFGPLSLLAAPPSVTRRLEMTYSRPITPDLEFFIVNARVEGRDGRQLELRADVVDRQGARLARAQATHWIIDGF